MVPDARVSDWLESGVVALSGFVPPGNAATKAREWSRELAELSAARGHPVLVDGARFLAERVALTGAQPPTDPRVSVGGAARLLACADGWVAVSLPRPSDLELVAPLIEATASDPWTSLAAWVGEREAAEIVARGRLLGIALSQVGVSATPLKLNRAAFPRPTFDHWPGKAPLVVDFSSLWAGPLCASLLGLAGARVIKVESAARLDGARLGESRFFDLLHAGHESVCVDPQVPADRRLLQSLVDAADVVIEASRPRALAGWGLSAADAVAAGTVWMSITAYGRGQPDRVGFGDDVAAGAGLVGWLNSDPCFVGDAIADPLTGLAAAVATLRALSYGRGQFLDLAMASVVVSTLDGTETGSADGLPSHEPFARDVVGQAAAAGADTAAIVKEFT